MEQLVAAVFFDGSLALGQPPECSVAFRYDDGRGPPAVALNTLEARCCLGTSKKRKKHLSLS